MRLIVGLTKKIGLPSFGSVGATCQLESGELPASLAAGDFKERVARAFDACRQAVEAELAKHAGAHEQPPPRPHEGDGITGGGSERHPRSPDFKSRPATPKQLNALRALAARSRRSRAELDRMFGKPLGAMTVADASAAIDRLKDVAPLNGREMASRNGKGGRMSAKHKLNAAQFNGALFVAGLLGLVTGSGVVFLLAAAILIVTGWHAGGIRGGR